MFGGEKKKREKGTANGMKLFFTKIEG